MPWTAEKLPKESLNQIRNMFNEGLSGSEIARRLNIDKRQVSLAKRFLGFSPGVSPKESRSPEPAQVSSPEDSSAGTSVAYVPPVELIDERARDKYVKVLRKKLPIHVRARILAELAQVKRKVKAKCPGCGTEVSIEFTDPQTSLKAISQINEIEGVASAPPNEEKPAPLFSVGGLPRFA